MLLALQRERGTTVILATHDHAVAARCHRVVRLADGTVIEDLRVTAYPEAGSLPEQIARLRGS